MFFRKRGIFPWKVPLFFFVTFLILAVGPTAQARRLDTATYQRRLREQKLEEKLSSFSVPPFKVFVRENLPRGFKKKIERVIRNTIREIGEDLDFFPEQSMEISLLNGAIYDSIDDPEIATGGFYQNRKIRMKFDYHQPETEALSGFERVFRHEYTHLVIASLDAGKTPRWLNEGLAVYESKRRAERKRGEGKSFYEKKSAEGTLVPIEEFVSADLRAQYTRNNADFYDQSYVLAKYLVDRYGFFKLRRLLQRMKEGGFFRQALEEVYGLQLENLAKGAYES